MDMQDIIKTRRRELGLTLQQVGNAVGVGKSTVRKWENGDIANMKRDKIAKLAAVLDVSPAYLMGIEEKLPTNISEEKRAFIELLDNLSDEQIAKLHEIAKAALAL